LNILILNKVFGAKLAGPTTILAAIILAPAAEAQGMDALAQAEAVARDMHGGIATGDPADPLAPLSQRPPAGDGHSDAAAQVIDWVSRTHDNQNRPFIVVDKARAQVLAFDADGKPVGAAPALLGITRGDDSAPGVGERELRKIPVADRTTPAGRFVAKYGPAGGGHSRVLWVDYGTAVSLHPVITANAKEHRTQRIKSATPDDNRITFGCINVPASFYAQVVKPLFGSKDGGIVYVLPEMKALSEVFPGVAVQQAAAL
jgi:hypothetical protein